MLQAAFGTMRDLSRLQEISSVLIRHGLGDIVQRLGVSGVLERAGQILQWGASAESLKQEPPLRMRLALEELGPTFVKLGQVLATRVLARCATWCSRMAAVRRSGAPTSLARERSTWK